MANFLALNVGQCDGVTAGNGGGNEDGNDDRHGRRGTPKGTHVITVIGTSGGSPTITHSQSFTLVGEVKRALNPE